MSTKTLERAQWKSYFNETAKGLETMQVEIEITGPHVGDQIEAEWVPLNGLSYDDRSNYFDVATSRLNHRIPDVKEISIEQDFTGLKSMEIIDGDGNHQILRFKPPLALPELAMM